MTTPRPLRFVRLVAIAIATTGLPTAQGQQNPAPPEARLVSRLPFVITEPGAYRLGRTLQAQKPTAKPALEIRCSHVDLDLDGQSLLGISQGPARSAISIGPYESIRIHHGGLRGWTGSGVEADDAARGLVLEDLRISELGAAGVLARGADHRLTRVQVRDAAADGVVVGDFARLEEVVTSQVQGRGAVVGDGGLLTGCRIAGSGPQALSVGDLCRLERCHIFPEDPGADGIRGGDQCELQDLEVELPTQVGSSVTLGESCHLESLRIEGGQLGVKLAGGSRVHDTEISGALVGFVGRGPALADCQVSGAELAASSGGLFWARGCRMDATSSVFPDLGAGSRVWNCRLTAAGDSPGSGITATSACIVETSHVEGFDIGIALTDSEVRQCTVLKGLSANYLLQRSAAARCFAHGAQGVGFRLTDRASVLQDAESITGSGTGVLLEGFGHLVVRSRSALHGTAEYDIAVPTDHFLGPITDLASATSPVGNVDQ